jgi:iron only hydrogenase large subunit-like protein
MNASGVRDVDHVLTTRELARMIRQANLAFTETAGRRDGRPAGAVQRRGGHLRETRAA